MGEDSDNAATFVAVKSNISDRTVTSATASWNPPDWTDGGTYQSSDISSVVKEIVDRGGWTISNAMVFIIRGPDETRIAYSYDGSVANAPVLHVEWTSSGGSDSGYAVNIDPDNNLPWGATIPIDVSASDPAANTLTTNYSFKIMDATNVHVVYQNKWFNTITNAVAIATNGDLIEVYPNTYNENVSIDNFTNLTIRAWDWISTTNNTSTIIKGDGSSTVININSSINFTLQGFSLNGNGGMGGITSITFNNSINNYILNNIIYSNDNEAIAINAGSDYNTFRSNTLFDQVWGVANQDGISVMSKHNIFEYNTFKRHSRGSSDAGINMLSTAISNTVRFNTFYSNDIGVYLNWDSSHNTVTNNNFYNNTNSGIYLRNSLTNYVYNNNIYNNYNYGITIEDADYNEFYNNTITNNDNTGIQLIGSSEENSISLNNIMGNLFGLSISDTAYTDNLIFKNNIINNGIGFTNETATVIMLTNNWWGNTIAGDIQTNIIGNGNYSNFTPYRLFGLFDITPGADTDTPDIVTNVQAVPFNSTNVALTWSAVTNPDLVRYFIYRNDINDTTNIARSTHFVGQSLITSFTEFGVNAGTNWYYFVTALDDHPVYTNESWYSIPAMVITGEPFIQMTKSVSPTNGVRPYEVLSYNIKYTNSGDADASAGLNIIEELPPNVLLITNSAEISNSIHAGSVTVYYSTNLSGSWWTNSNYDSAATVDKIKRVKWVFSANTSVGTNGTLRFKVLIK